MNGILLAITSYPIRTSDSAVLDAVSIAAALDARLTALAFNVRINVPGTPFGGDAFIDVSAIIGGEEDKSAQYAAQLIALANDEAKKQGVSFEAVCEEAFTSEVPYFMAEYARLRDLTIVPVPNEQDFDRWTAESIIFNSGRPALLVPPNWKRQLPLRTAVVGWDFSRVASRAVADAMPVLRKTNRTYVLTVANEKEIDTRRSAAELARHLAHNGVQDVVVETVDASGRAIGTVIETFCDERNADVLIMGAYGHSRLRELILGGATRAVMSKPKLPVLLSH